jgi:hypothetical protein
MPHRGRVEVMPTQLLVDPEARERVDRCLVEERLRRLDFQEFYVINKQFERDL